MGIGAAVIVGHSMGSLNARAFAHAYPSRTLGLVLMGAFASVHGNAAVEELCLAVHDLTDPVPDAFARDFQVSTIHHPIPDAFLDMAVSESLKLPARVWQACVAGMKVRDRTFTGSGIAAPVLIVWGAHDTICTRADQETLKTAFNKSRLVVYPDAGHAVHWEFPDAVAADLAAWLRPIERAREKRAA
jgi:pimeloyl-ACP methyl ester carboxylesterase